VLVRASGLVFSALLFGISPSNAQDSALGSGGYDWSGAYVGGLIGFASIEQKSTAAAVGSLSSTADSISLGIQGGGNVQINQWVFGIEGDVSWVDATANVSATLGALTYNGRSNVDWSGTITGRVGYAFDNLLLYGEGGLGLMGVEYTGSVVGVAGSSKVSDTRTGWLLGAGLEYGLTENLTAKLEYNYIDFGSKTYNFTLAGTATPIKIDSHEHLVRLGVNYKFSVNY